MAVDALFQRRHQDRWLITFLPQLVSAFAQIRVIRGKVLADTVAGDRVPSLRSGQSWRSKPASLKSGTIPFL
jgi:hypothetical protein